MKVSEIQLQKSSGSTFTYSIYIGKYTKCMKAIEQAGEQTPTYADVIDFMYEAKIRDPYHRGSEMEGMMKAFKLTADTSLLYLPDGRVFVQDRPQLIDLDGFPVMQESELEAKLQAGDSSVRLVTDKFKIGEQSSLELAENKLVMALAGSEEHVRKLVELLDSYKLKPYLFALKDVKQPTVTVSSLFGYWNSGPHLFISGCDHNDYDSDFSFGVRYAEDDAQKIAGDNQK